MSFTEIPPGIPSSLIESLLQGDRPDAWWGLDTADPLVDDSGNGYTLTAIGTPSNAVSLHTRGDNGLSGCRDFNGTTGGYYTLGTLYSEPERFPNFVAAGPQANSATATIAAFLPDGCQVGDFALMVLSHTTAAATISTPPAGWTQVNTTLNAGSAATAVYKRTIDGTEVASYATVWSGAGTVIGQILVWRGLDPTVSGLVFDTGQQATASGTFHSTTTENNPTKAFAIVILAAETTATITELEAGRNRAAASSANLKFRVTEYEVEAAGSTFQIAYTSAATSLGAIILTFGAPQVVVNDALDTITGRLSIGCLINPDTVAAGARNIARKEGCWILQVDAAVLKFFYHDGTAYRSHSGPTLAAGTTYRIWVKDDGTSIHFFVNGSKTTVSRFNALPYPTNANRVTIGHFWNGAAASEYFDGRIDELALFAAPLADQQIYTHEEAATQGTFGELLQPTFAGKSPPAKVEIAENTSNPTDRCFTYRDVTAAVRRASSFTTDRGRNFELDRMKAGTFTFACWNGDRSFDTIKARRVVRFRAQVQTDGPVFPVYLGYTDAPAYESPGGGFQAVVVFQASDMKDLSLAKIKTTFVRQTETAGPRIEAVLADVPGLATSIEDGVHQIIGGDLIGEVKLEHCQAVAETDGGVFFRDARGRATFHNNQHRSKFETAVRATYSQKPALDGGYQIKTMRVIVDESSIFTGAAVTPASGNVQRSSNDAAALEYFELTKEVSTLHASDADALAMAHHISGAYSTRLERVVDFTLQPSSAFASLTMWAVVFATDIGHRIKVNERPIGKSTVVPREQFVEGISHSLAGGDWIVGYALSPTEVEGRYFKIGTSKIGDPNAVIGW